MCLPASVPRFSRDVITQVKILPTRKSKSTMGKVQLFTVVLDEEKKVFYPGEVLEWRRGG